MNRTYIDTETMRQFRRPNAAAVKQYAALAAPCKGVTDNVVARHIKVLEFFCEMYEKYFTIVKNKPPFFVVEKKPFAFMMRTQVSDYLTH